MTTLSPPGALDANEIDLILEDPLALESRDDAPEVVLALPSQVFLQIARALENEGRLEILLAHASAEQLTSLFDLDVWLRDRVNIGRARAWLTAISDSYELAGRARGDLVGLMRSMDPEMWTLALTPGTVVIELDPEQDDSLMQAMAALGDRFTYETPDGAFVVGVPDDDAGRMAVHVIARIYRDSLSAGRRLVSSVAWAIQSELEEDLFRWRSGRLADLGFVGWEEAMRLFRPLDRDAAVERTDRAEVFVPEELGLRQQPLVGWGQTSLLSRVIDRLEPHEHGVRSREFMLLANEVVAAQRYDPGDIELARRATEQTHATVELGLEMLAAARPGHPDPGAFLADRVVTLGLRGVFRVGYGALDKLRRAALALHRGGRVSLGHVGSLLDRPWGPALRALSGFYPALPVPSTSGSTRPIRGSSDLARATELISGAAALASLCFAEAGYAVDPAWVTRADHPDKLTLGDLIRTQLVLEARRRSGPLGPLRGEDLAWASGHMLEAGKLVPAIRHGLRARCEKLEISSHYEALAETLLTRLEVELGALESEDGVVDLTRTGGLLTVHTVSMWLASGEADHSD